MSASVKAWALAGLIVTSLGMESQAGERRFPTIGGPPNPVLLEAWDIDIAPDGRGAPPGQGTVADGEEIYFEKCSACHGDFGEGVGNIVPLMGGEDTLKDERPVKTIGSYWPYAAVIIDYTKRTMPFGDAQSLTNDEVYAVTAYVLYMNDLISEETVLGPETIGQVSLPNAELFIPDPRPDAQPPTGKACMTDCEGRSVIGRARQVDVTQGTDN